MNNQYSAAQVLSRSRVEHVMDAALEMSWGDVEFFFDLQEDELPLFDFDHPEVEETVNIDADVDIDAKEWAAEELEHEDRFEATNVIMRQEHFEREFGLHI